MLNQLLIGGLVSLVNFGIHALMTGSSWSRHITSRAATDDLHVFTRVSRLVTVALVVLMLTHVSRSRCGPLFTPWAGIETEKAGAFEFAFEENYTALGYGDAVATQGNRLMGPITALNGLLLIGWSVAIIFEVGRMAEFNQAPRRSPIDGIGIFVHPGVGP